MRNALYDEVCYDENYNHQKQRELEEIQQKKEREILQNIENYKFYTKSIIILIILLYFINIFILFQHRY